MDTDWELLEQFHGGNSHAFERLFNKHKVHVINLALRFVKRQDVAEDIAQDVFIKIYEKKFPVRHQAKFSTWLYRVTINAALDVLRTRKRQIGLLDAPASVEQEDGTPLLETLADPNTPLPADVAEQHDAHVIVQGAIDKLPIQLRTPLVLYQFQQLSYAEIGQILGISEKAVERRLYHAREELRKTLTKSCS